MELLKIEILIHYYQPRGMHNDYPGINFPGGQETIRELLAKGLIRENWASTRIKYAADMKACKLYMEALCNVPLPRRKWVSGKKNHFRR